MNFKVIEKFVDFSGETILDIGNIIEPIDGKYTIKWENNGIWNKMAFDYDGIKNLKQSGKTIFREIKDKDINISIKEIEDTDEEKIKNWRIQLDVKTSRKNLLLIENLIREKVFPYIK